MDREPLVRPEAYAADIQRLQRARAAAVAEAEDQLALAFLEQAAAEPGATRTDSGLVIREVTAGTGEQPSPTDTVRVHYHGTLRDGTVFDSSEDRGTPAVFPLNRVIACWTEALQQMRVGSKIKLTCPPDTAYGDRGAPPKIGPGATLAFDVELLEIVDASPPKAGAQ
jgi:FKBP-type peptidyl-prolyl cis-trans isomerase FkpA